MQVIFAVADLDRSLDFYERALGWPRNERIDFSNYVERSRPDGNVIAVAQSVPTALTTA